jgi:hypothetical protein
MPAMTLWINWLREPLFLNPGTLGAVLHLCSLILGETGYFSLQRRLGGPENSSGSFGQNRDHYPLLKIEP